MKQATAWVFVVIFGAVSADEGKTDWVKVADKDAKFEGQFPAKPKELPEKGRKRFFVERESGKVTLMLQADVFPQQVDTGNADAVKLIMDNSRAALVKSFKGAKLLSEKDLKFAKKHPARDVNIDIPAAGVFRVRMIITPSRLYQVVILGSKDYQKGAEAKQFVESFKLTD